MQPRATSRPLKQSPSSSPFSIISWEKEFERSENTRSPRRIHTPRRSQQPRRRGVQEELGTWSCWDEQFLNSDAGMLQPLRLYTHDSLITSCISDCVNGKSTYLCSPMFIISPDDSIETKHGPSVKEKTWCFVDRFWHLVAPTHIFKCDYWSRWF